MNHASSPPEPASRAADVALGCAVVAITGLLVVPLPGPILDLLLAANLGIAALMLLIALFVPEASRLTSMPPLLLLTTLLRAVLSVCAARLILFGSSVGVVIPALGSAMAGSTPGAATVIGAVVFIILVFVQFVVVAKGSERVAEVAARFTLDAMPGKQMSIDADVRAGLLAPDQARAARRELERESRLYGAMDGAMRFVKGDAAAGFVIAIITMVGGLALALWTRRSDQSTPVSFSDSLAAAAGQYGLLTIGAGLAAQISSILTSLAAGLVVTRVAGADGPAPVARDLVSQTLAHPLASGVASALLLLLGLVMAAWPFLVLSVVLGLVSANAWRAARTPPPPPRPAQDGLPPVRIRLHPSLRRALLDPAVQPSIPDRLSRLRQTLHDDVGLSIPAIEIDDNGPAALGELGYSIDIHGIPASVGTFPRDGVFLACDAAAAISAGMAANPVAAPWSRVELCAIPAAQAASAPAPVLTTADALEQHVRWVIKRKLEALLGLQDVAAMIESVRATRPDLVRAVTPAPLSLQLITDVLRRLLREHAPIRFMPAILDSLARHAHATKNPSTLAERVRRDLADALCARFSTSPGKLSFYAADPELENLVGRSLEETPDGPVVTLSHDDQQRVVDSLKRVIDPRRHQDQEPVLMVNSFVRRPLRSVIEDALPDVAVMSYDELSRDVELERLGLVVLES